MAVVTIWFQAECESQGVDIVGVTLEGSDTGTVPGVPSATQENTHKPSSLLICVRSPYTPTMCSSEASEESGLGKAHCLMRQSAEPVKRARLRSGGGGVSVNSNSGDEAEAGIHTASTQWEWPSKVCLRLPSLTFHSFAVLRHRVAFRVHLLAPRDIKNERTYRVIL